MNPWQEEKGNAVLATDRTHDTSNKIECFSYKGEWAKTYYAYKEGYSLASQ